MNLHQFRFVREAVRQKFNLTEAAKALLYIPVNSVSMKGQDIVLNLQNGSQVPLSQVSTMR